MTGRMASNDDAVAFLNDRAPRGLDVDLVAGALECRRTAADPDRLFPARTGLPRQVAACAQLVAAGAAEGPNSDGGPPGERNGQYRHGERTKAAIAERQKFSALLRMLRAGLT
jgi:hypothetical protein